MQTSLEIQMHDPLRDAEARLQRFWNVDGLHEIGIAVLFGLTAVWVWSSDLADLPKFWKGVFSTTFPVLIFGGIYGEKWVVERIRRRMTVPRVGFVKLRRPSVRMRLGSGVGGAVAAVLVAAMAVRDPSGWERWAGAAMGLMVGGFLSVMAWKGQTPRFYAVAVVLAVTGAWISWARLPFAEALTTFWAVSAIAVLVSGGVTLWRFLHGSES
jgi:hypothetical protein